MWRGTHLTPLDGLRGAAVLGVLAFHDRRLRGGWLGVDLFFTLSGFLITSLLVAELDRSGTIRLGSFWQRRARRLLPPLLALVGVLVLWDRFGPTTPWASSDLRGAAIASLAYVGNWYQAFAGGGYWAHFGATPSPLRHTWSLAIEEQFYLVFPLVVWVCCRWTRRPVQLLLVLCTTGSVLSLLATLILGRSGHPDRVYLGTDTRVGSILIGAVLACLLTLSKPRAGGESLGRARVLMADAAGLGSVLALGVLWTRMSGAGRFGLHGGLSIHAVLVAVVVGVVVRVPGSVTARLLSFTPLVWLGTISYGLYLWHWPVFLYVDQRLTLEPLPATGVKLAGSLGLAIVSYFLLERPVRLKGTRALGGPIPAFSLVALVVLGAAAVPPVHSVLSASAPTSGGDLHTLPTVTGPIGPVTVPTSSTTPGAPPTTLDAPVIEPAGMPVSGSVMSRPGRTPGPARMLVLGDSVPYLMALALVPKSAAYGLVVANRALVACSAARPTAERIGGDRLPRPGDCSARWAADAAAFDPDVVVLSLNGDVGITLKIHGEWGGVCDPPYTKEMSERLSTAFAQFTNRGGRVFVLTPLPTESPIMRSDETIAATKCLGDLERIVARGAPGVSVVPFGSWVCPGERLLCRPILGGRHIRRTDGVHFIGDDALHVWGLLLPGIYRSAGLIP